MSVLALALVVLLLGGRPALSQADGLSLSVEAPGHVTMPNGATLEMSVGGDLTDVAVGVYDDYWNYIGGCEPTDGTCEYVALAYLQAGGSHAVEAHFKLQAVGPNKFSNVVSTTVTYDPPAWEVAFDMPAEVTMPDRIPINFATTPALNSGHSVELFDADSNQYADFNCPTQ